MSGEENSSETYDPRDDSSEVNGWILRIVIASVLGLGWLGWIVFYS